MAPPIFFLFAYCYMDIAGRKTDGTGRKALFLLHPGGPELTVKR
jgi:hypothetical protein